MVVCQVILVGANRLFLEGLSLTLESDTLTVTHTVPATELSSLLSTIDEQPDLIVWDSSANIELDLPRWAETHDEFAGIGIVALADRIDGDYVNRALAGGVRGVLPKSISTEALRLSLKSIACAENVTIIPFDFVRREPVAVRHPVDPRKLPVPLSSREAEILECLGKGAPNKVIARELSLAEATIKVHIKALLRKINVSNRTQAAVWCRAHQSSGRWKNKHYADRSDMDRACLQSAE